MSQEIYQANEFSDVFISYRRIDVEFVKKLVQALHEANKEVWVDWEDIPPGSENFDEYIKRGLEGSDAFIAVLSPDYLESKYCVEFELSHAMELNKKIIPIVLDKFDDRRVPFGISHINWIYFTPHAGQENTFEESFPRILQALNLDFEHSRTHKRLEIRALEWDNNQRSNSFLLTGDEIQQAEIWISGVAGKTPQPTSLHQDYIRASRLHATNVQRQVLFAVSIALIVALGLAVVSVFFGFRAYQSANAAATSEAQAITNADFAEISEAEALRNANLAGTSEANALRNANLAGTSEAQAIANSNLAETSEANALRNAQLAETSEAQAITNANLAEANAIEALNSALTATVAQGEAQLEANAAGTSEAQAINNAITATLAQGEALNNAELALNNAATADSARATAEYLEQAARAQALAVYADQALAVGEVDLALALAIEAGQLNPALLFAQHVLSQAAPLGVRLSLETYADTVSFFDSPLDQATAPYGGIAAFSADGSLLAVAKPNNDIAIWNLDSRENVQNLTGHQYRITALLFDESGRYLISSSANLPQASSAGELLVWDLYQNGQVRRLEGHTKGVIALALRPNDSNIVASVSEDGRAILWDYETGFQLAAYSAEETSPLRQVHWNFDGTILYAVSDNQSIIRRLDENLETENLLIRTEPLYRGFSQNNQYAYTGGYQPATGTLSVWNANNATLVREFGLQRFTPLEDYVRFVDFTPPNYGTVLVYLEQWLRLSGSDLVYRDNKLALWDIFSNTELSVLNLDDSIRITAMAYSSDGNYLLTADNDGLANTLTLRNARDGSPLRRYYGHPAIIDQIAFSPDGHRAISIDRSGSVRVWDIFLEDSSKLQDFSLNIPLAETTNTRIPSIVTSGERVIAAQASYLISIDANAGQTIGTSQYVSDTILDAKFDLAQNLALIRLDATRTYAPIVLWQIGGERLATIGALDGDTFTDGAFTSDGTALILLGQSQAQVGIIARYDISTNPSRPTLIYRLEVTDQDASEELANSRYLALSPDGRYLATVGTYHDRINGSSDDELIVIWDALQGIALNQIRIDSTGGITDISFSPNNRNILTSFTIPNQSMIQWDIFTGEQLVQFTGHSATVNVAIYNHDGTMVLSGSADGTVILWDAASGQAIRSYLGHGSSVTGVAFYNEEQAIISISQTGVLLWRIESFQDIVQWINQNRFVPTFTCAQRLQYNIRPYCEVAVVSTTVPSNTATPSTELAPSSPTVAITASPQISVSSSPTPSISPSSSPSPSPSATATSVLDTGYQITASELVPIRVLPNLEAQALPRLLQNGEFVEILEQQGAWLRIRLQDRSEGWIPLATVNNGDL